MVQRLTLFTGLSHTITASPTGKELVISFPNGSQQKSKLEISTLKVEFGNYSQHRKLTVADLTTNDVIYGRHWLASHQLHLNWKNYDVRFHSSVHVNASADFGEDDVILSQISDSINAMEANCLVCEDRGENFSLF